MVVVNLTIRVEKTVILGVMDVPRETLEVLEEKAPRVVMPTQLSRP